MKILSENKAMIDGNKLPKYQEFVCYTGYQQNLPPLV